MGMRQEKSLMIKIIRDLIPGHASQADSLLLHPLYYAFPSIPLYYVFSQVFGREKVCDKRWDVTRDSSEEGFTPRSFTILSFTSSEGKKSRRKKVIINPTAENMESGCNDKKRKGGDETRKTRNWMTNESMK